MTLGHDPLLNLLKSNLTNCTLDKCEAMVSARWVYPWQVQKHDKCMLGPIAPLGKNEIAATLDFCIRAILGQLVTSTLHRASKIHRSSRHKVQNTPPEVVFWMGQHPRTFSIFSLSVRVSPRLDGMTCGLVMGQWKWACGSCKEALSKMGAQRCPNVCWYHFVDFKENGTLSPR